MRKVLGMMAAAAVGTALLACNRPPPPQQQALSAPLPPASYGESGYGRGDAPPDQLPQTYGAPYGRADIPPQYPQPRSYGGAPPPYERADAPDQDQRLVWKTSPRWAAVKSGAKSEGTGEVRRSGQDKLRLAQAKAAKVGVENLSGEDIEGLSSAELKELRGY